MFENLKLKYKVGDYIYIETKQQGTLIDLYGKIVSLNPHDSDNNPSWFYKVYVIDSADNKLKYIYIRQYIIIRKMTSEEIKEFETKKLSLKYNI